MNNQEHNDFFEFSQRVSTSVSESSGSTNCPAVVGHSGTSSRNESGRRVASSSPAPLRTELMTVENQGLLAASRQSSQQNGLLPTSIETTSSSLPYLTNNKAQRLSPRDLSVSRLGRLSGTVQAPHSISMSSPIPLSASGATSSSLNGEQNCLAVVPFGSTFVPSPRERARAPKTAHASLGGESRNSAHNLRRSASGSVGGSPRRSASVPLGAGALVPLCPTCHRPMDAAPFAKNADGFSSHKLSPQYFRQLTVMGPPPLLAIEDVHPSTSISAPESAPPHDRFLRHSASHNSTPATTPHTSHRRSRRQSLNTPDGGRSGRRSRRGSVNLETQSGIYSYVSPTTATEPNYGQKGSPNPPQEPYIDEDLLALLAKHQASLRGEHDDNSEDYDVMEGEPLPPKTSQSYYEQYFLESKKLGSGTYGGVYLCMHVMEGVPLGTFALKKIPVGDNIAYLQNVLREVRILEEVKRHPNVIEYNHSWVDVAKMADFGPPVRCLFILMEYANEGCLESYLERHSTVLSTMAVWYFFLSAVAGTAHLHQKNILHRDLKPQNLLLSARTRDGPPRVLVSDFGTSALLGESLSDRTGGTGTLEYMAPELFERDPAAPPNTERYLHSHTKASDVWSLGMILHYLACGTALPERGPRGSVVLDIENLSPVPRPPEMIELIRAMLQLDPKKRPSCKDIMRSTVVQTLLYSFNNTPFSRAELFSPMYNPVVSSDDSEESGEEDEQLESSRVELLSTLAITTPLIQQYVNHEQRNATASPSSPLSKLQGMPSNKNTTHPRPGSPKVVDLFYHADHPTRDDGFPASIADVPGKRSRPVTPSKPAGPNQRTAPSYPQLYRHAALLPPPKRTVDASVQTDPVTIL